MKVGRNDSCPCGSGKKYKNCCREKPLPATISTEKELFALLKYGESLFNENRNEEAKKIFEKLVVNKVSKIAASGACVNLGHMLMSANVVESERYFKLALELNPENNSAPGLLGLMYFKRQKRT